MSRWRIGPQHLRSIPLPVEQIAHQVFTDLQILTDPRPRRPHLQAALGDLRPDPLQVLRMGLQEIIDGGQVLQQKVEILPRLQQPERPHNHLRPPGEARLLFPQPEEVQTGKRNHKNRHPVFAFLCDICVSAVK